MFPKKSLTKLCISVFVFQLFACQKYKVEELHPEFVGEWIHHSGTDTFIKIYIQKNGRGSIWSVNEEGTDLDTQRRAWLIKNNSLQFSRWIRISFAITNYPEKADSLIISYFDTIKPGENFMILDQNYFKQLK